VTGNVRILSIGVDHRAAGSALRERLSGAWEATIADVVEGGGAIAGVTLRTCLRAEAYLAVVEPVRSEDVVAQGLSVRAALPRGGIDAALAVRTDRAAVEHLFSVAAGLESMILGERQVLDQVRDAWDRWRASASPDPHLDRLFQHAVAAGKRVRRDTGLGRGGRSVTDTAAGLVAQCAGELGGAAVTIVGAGTVARATAVALGRRGARTFAVVNRSADRGAALAADIDRRGWTGVALPWEHLTHAAAAADVIVCATGAPGQVLGAGDLPGGRRRVVVDLAMPRDVHPAIGEISEVTLVDLDAVWRHAPRAESASIHLPEARAIVTDRVEAYMRWMAEREAAPAIADLRRRTLPARSTPESRRALHDRTLALKRGACESAGRRLESGAARL
jgi:glutamyl-tRNA reductase